MSVSVSTSPPVPFWGQLLAWIAGLGICLAGLFDQIPGWNFPWAVSALILLALAPVCWMGRPQIRKTKPSAAQPFTSQNHLLPVAVVMACSLGMSAWTADQIGWDLPPTYHDEYSYLFQAKTFLAGRTWFPSHPTHPELFDQMHVLNDHGVMASRYFPGTGFWMAPFVACGHPYLGHWICGMLAAAFAYATGCELGNQRCGWITGLLMATSPGLALFSNMLLAHHPTLMGLSFFLWRMSRLQRTFSPWDAWLAGLGLSWAMLCRPMTAAGFGLPFGIWTAGWLLRGSAPRRQRWLVCIGFAVTIGLGMAIQLADNASITGSLWKSPYQLYTDIYTPRHVYGFQNVVRGEQQIGPKTLVKYEQWAKNLDAKLAAKNVAERLIQSLVWTWDILPLTMLCVLILSVVYRWPARNQLIVWAIVSLHAVHIPYWYAGIMGWHYVFETSLLWFVLCGLILGKLFGDWGSSGRPLMTVWALALCALTFVGNWCWLADVFNAKVSEEMKSLRLPRRMFQEFRTWTTATAREKPSLVLIAPHEWEPHLDFVVNDPGLTASCLYGRYVPGTTDPQRIARDFPDRSVWLCDPSRKQLSRVVPTP